MKAPLSPIVIAQLAVHDADLISVSVDCLINGDTNVLMLIEIDPEESLQSFLELGVKTRIVQIRFEKCWQIISSLTSYQHRREQIADWAAVSESAKLTELQKHCVSLPVHVFHHTFELSGGSLLEILAERVFVQDNK
jgi:hypothetical protein